MNPIKTGEAIKLLRNRLGFTQKDLAEQLNVTDKAVSKWERGISAPDISIITVLADLLNTDVDNIINGNVSYLDDTWIGYLKIKKSNQSSDIGLNTMLLDKPLVYIYISYFLLAGIKTVVIDCGKDERLSIQEKIHEIESLNIEIIFSTYESSIVKNKNIMMISDNCFIYGVNLTKYFNRAMSRNNGVTILSIPKSKSSYKQKRLSFGRSKQLTERHLYDSNKYYMEPIFFIPMDRASILETLVDYRDLANLDCVYAEPMGYGMIDFMLNTYSDIHTAASFVSIIEQNVGNKVYDLKEISVKRFG